MGGGGRLGLALPARTPLSCCQAHPFLSSEYPLVCQRGEGGFWGIELCLQSQLRAVRWQLGKWAGNILRPLVAGVHAQDFAPGSGSRHLSLLAQTTTLHSCAIVELWTTSVHLMRPCATALRQGPQHLTSQVTGWTQFAAAVCWVVGELLVTHRAL